MNAGLLIHTQGRCLAEPAARPMALAGVAPAALFVVAVLRPAAAGALARASLAIPLGPVPLPDLA